MIMIFKIDILMILRSSIMPIVLLGVPRHDSKNLSIVIQEELSSALLILAKSPRLVVSQS